jgi:uncharacterized protein (DUF488 family)
MRFAAIHSSRATSMADSVPEANMTLFTIGHSNHPIETFLDLLGRQQIEWVLDVRSSPYSQYATQFNREVLANFLQAEGIRYVFLGDTLGGRPQDAQFFDEQGHVLYDRVAQSAEFQESIDRLLDQPLDASQAGRAVLLCGEEDPTTCHRRLLVGRVLRRRGVNVLHIRGDGRLQSEDEVAEEERFAKTKGQMTLFDLEDADEWKSTQSVLPKKPRPSSSQS